MSTEFIPDPSPLPETPPPPPEADDRIFARDGWSIKLPIVDVIYQFGDLSRELDAAKKSQRDYLEQVRDLLAAKTGVPLTLDDADWINHELQVRFEARKKKRG